MKYLSDYSTPHVRKITPSDIDWGNLNTEHILHCTLRIEAGNGVLATIAGYSIGWASDGDTFAFPGVKEILHDYMIVHNLPVLEAQLYYICQGLTSEDEDTAVDEEEILFIESRVDSPSAGDFIESHFLMAGAVTTLVDGDSLPINVYITQNEIDDNPEGVQCVSRLHCDHNGTEFIRISLVTFTSAGLKTFYLSFKDNIQHYPVRYAEVTCGQRRFTVYAIDEPRLERFDFLNRFNSPEHIWVPAVITSKPNTEFDEAVCAGNILQYDIRHSTEEDLNTPPMPNALRPVIEQMVQSSACSYKSLGIVIREYTIEESTGANSPFTLDMTFVFSDTINHVSL